MDGDYSMIRRDYTDMVRLTAADGFILRCGDVTAKEVACPPEDVGLWTEEPETAE